MDEIAECTMHIPQLNSLSWISRFVFARIQTQNLQPKFIQPFKYNVQLKGTVRVILVTLHAIMTMNNAQRCS